MTYVKTFASTLSQEQLPFIIAKLANYSVRRMVEQYGVKGSLEIIAGDEKQQRVLERIINEEFNHLPILSEIKAGTWLQFVEPKRYRHVVGRVKSVTKELIRVSEYTDTGGKSGWAPTGQEWTVVPDLISDIVMLEPKLTVEQKLAADRKAEKEAEKAAAPAANDAVREAA
jgi:hypothetical protein